MRMNTILLAASLGLCLTGVALAQGVPGGGGSGGNFQSQPDVNLSGPGSRAFGGPATTGSVGRSAPADLGDATDGDDEDGEEAVDGGQDRREFGRSDGRVIQRR